MWPFQFFIYFIYLVHSNFIPHNSELISKNLIQSLTFIQRNETRKIRCPSREDTNSSWKRFKATLNTWIFHGFTGEWELFVSKKNELSVFFISCPDILEKNGGPSRKKLAFHRKRFIPECVEDTASDTSVLIVCAFTMHNLHNGFTYPPGN